MPELAHFPAYVRTGCVRTYAAIDPKHAYRRDKRKRQGTTAMVIPCLCSFLLTVLSSASAGTCRGEAPPSCCARPFCRLKAPLGLSLFRFAPQTRIVYFFVLGAISNMTVTRIYKPYSNQVMVLFQGKLISGWFNANTINAIAIISIIKPRILDIRFFMQSTSLSNWNC